MMSSRLDTQRSSQSKRSWLMPAGRTAAARQPRMREIATAAAAIIAGRGPQRRRLPRRIEAPTDEARREAGIGGEHLMGRDQRKERAECDHDAGLHAGQRLGQFDMHGHRDLASARRVVEPVDPVEIAGIGIVGADRRKRGVSSGGLRGEARLGKLGEASAGARRPSGVRAPRRAGARRRPRLSSETQRSSSTSTSPGVNRREVSAE